MIVEGNVSVKAVLEGNKRKAETLYIKKGKSSKDIAYIRRIAIEHGVTIEILDESSFHGIAPGKTNGGIALSCGSRKRETLNDLVQPNAIALLEGIEDPFNLGYCIRSLYSFGFDLATFLGTGWDHVQRTDCGFCGICCFYDLCPSRMETFGSFTESGAL